MTKDEAVKKTEVENEKKLKDNSGNPFREIIWPAKVTNPIRMEPNGRINRM
jgi:hypothetical protein